MTRCFHAPIPDHSAMIHPLLAAKEANEPRIPSLMAIMKASKKEILLWNLADIGLSPEQVGAAGSGVKIIDVLAPKAERKKTTIKGETAAEIADQLVKALIEDGVVGR